MTGVATAVIAKARRLKSHCNRWIAPRFSLAVAAIMLTAGEAAAGSLDFMSGIWRGEGLTMILDVPRLQGNITPDKSFQREPLIIRNVTGEMVVFRIGERQFIGLFKDDTVTITGYGISGSPVLQRAE